MHDEQSLPSDDPHASKISPDDPRLRVERPRSRVLKMRPVILSVAVLLGAGGLAIASSARQSPDKKRSLRDERPKVPERPPEVPDFIREAAKQPERSELVTSHGPADAFAFPAPNGTLATPPNLELERRMQLEEAARNSDMFFQARGSDAASRAPVGLDTAAAGQNPSERYPLTTLPGAALAAGSLGANAWDPNLQGRKNAFLDDPRVSSDYLPNGIQPALSPYELKATAIIPATLITGINSDLPGPIIAQVRERVYDTVTGQHLLIPQGARLLASYDSMVAWGQQRVLLCWNRILFPNGDSLNLQCMPAADLQGQAGLTDQVDEHWDRLLGAVALSTVLSLGMQASAGSPSGYQPTLAQSAARNAAGEINSIGQGMVQRQLSIQPTITVRPGFGLNVIVTKDLVLKPYVD